jgi:hypothetical protein
MAMKKKNREPASAGQKSLRQTRAEKQAVKKFNTELRKKIDRVDWAKVKLPRLYR